MFWLCVELLRNAVSLLDDLQSVSLSSSQSPNPENTSDDVEEVLVARTHFLFKVLIRHPHETQTGEVVALHSMLEGI